MSQWVYVYSDAKGRVLYVGRTARPTERIVEHARQASWWPQVHAYTAHAVANLEDAKRLELFLGDLLQPAFGTRTRITKTPPPTIGKHIQ